VLGGDAEADQPAPVLADEGDVAEIELLDRGPDPVDVALVGVVLTPGRLVRSAEADQVRRDGAVPGRGDARTRRAVKVRPRRLTMQEEYRRRPRALVDDVHAQAADVHVARRECEIGEMAEAIFRGADEFHAGPPLAPRKDVQAEASRARDDGRRRG